MDIIDHLNFPHKHPLSVINFLGEVLKVKDMPALNSEEFAQSAITIEWVLSYSENKEV